MVEVSALVMSLNRVDCSFSESVCTNLLISEKVTHSEIETFTKKERSACPF